MKIIIETSLITTMTLHVRVPGELCDTFESEIGVIVAGVPLDLVMGWNCPPDRVSELLDDCERGAIFDFLTDLQNTGRLENADDVFFFSDRHKTGNVSGDEIVSG